MDRGAQDSGITLAELLASFSLAIDLGLGQPLEHLLGAWQIADHLAEHVGLTAGERQSLFYVAMLAWVGCVADTPEVAAIFGDDIRFRADSYNVDFAGLPGLVFLLGHAATGRPAAARIGAVSHLVATGARKVAGGIQSHCVTTAAMAGQLGLAPEVGEALRLYFARWDGRGIPHGVGGRDIPTTVRIFQLADVVEVHLREHGRQAAIEMARARRGRQFDPTLVDTFRAAADKLVAACAGADFWSLLASTPGLARPLSTADLDSALEILADFTDLRSAFRAGHSRAVAELAATAAKDLGLPAAEVTEVRRAALLHDVGMHGLPATILDKEGPLTTSETERLRLSTYYTQRVLARPAALAGIGTIAAMSGERMDGSGYHRGLAGPAIPMTGRVLAAACAFRELTEERAHRPPLTVAEAANDLRCEVRAGRLASDAVEAVLAASGTGRRRRRTGPAGLTPREVEVLVLIARGASTGDVARELVISKKTAGIHIERIYAKTGASSRSTATLFALQNGLLEVPQR